jgi:transposase-like protein
MVFATYNQSEGVLLAAMAEMVVNGVSTRKVYKVVEHFAVPVYLNRQYPAFVKSWKRK